MTVILTAIDGSKHSEKVADYAANLAKATSSNVVLVFVAPKKGVPDEYKEYVENEGVIREYYEEFARRVLEDYKGRIEEKGVKVEALSGSGNATQFILDTAKSRDANQIVIGLHGLHRLAKIQALGSVARRVVENSSIPVTVVP